MSLANVTRRSIINVAGVLDTPLKLVNIKSLKMNCKIMPTATKTSKIIAIFQREDLLGGIFFGGNFLEVFFSGGGGIFSWGHFFGHYFKHRYALSSQVF